MTLSDVETPAVVLDFSKLVTNLKQVREIAEKHGVAVRPHIKTHKSFRMAQMQMDDGAVGITCAKTSEAIKFMEYGIRSVTVAHPLVATSKLERVIGCAKKYDSDLRIVCDSAEGVSAISHAANSQTSNVGVFLKVDVGLHRCGLQEDDERLVPLVRQIVEDANLVFRGLLSHAGHVYGALDAQSATDIAREECEILQRVKSQLESSGIDVPEVSVGSTPTILASETYEGITEIRPGNYVFMDRTPLRLELIDREQIALTILATVVSKNQDYFILDSGSKIFSSDMGAHGTSSVRNFGEVYAVEDFDRKESPLSLAKLSEEHGFVTRNGRDLPIGQTVRVIPNHSCVAANLVDHYAVLMPDSSVEKWPVDARGMVQ